MVPAPALAAPFAAAQSPSANIPDWPEKKSRTPWIIGGLVALIAIGAGIFVLTRDEPLPPPSPISALPPAVPTAAHPAEATPSAATADPATANPGAATAQSPGSHAAVEPPGTQPAATPNAGFAELFASGARHADEKTGAGATQRFDPKIANAALAAAAFETAKCKEKGGPTGKATIVVTFEPSGKVGSATVSDAPFAGTSSGACISAAMKRATVPPFSGLPGTVTKILSIQ